MHQHPNAAGGGMADSGVGLWTRFKGRVFQGDSQGVNDGPPR